MIIVIIMLLFNVIVVIVRRFELSIVVGKAAYRYSNLTNKNQEGYERVLSSLISWFPRLLWFLL